MTRFRNFGFLYFLICGTLLFSCLIVGSANASGQEAVEDLNQLLDQKIDILLSRDLHVVDAVATSVTPGSLPNSIKNLKVSIAGSKKSKSVSASRVQEIYLGGYPLDVQYDKKNKCLVHNPENRTARLNREKLISERLAVNRHKLWKPVTEQEHEKFMASSREFIKKVQSDTPGLRLVETNFFLFLTDLNDRDLSGYIGYLDAMYVELCKAFGLSPLKNIWCGKCVVVAFEQENRYLRFEAVHMDNPSARGTQGLCHQYSDGRVIFAGFQGKRDFAHVLVHETSHGFVHRYLSSARAPSWLNEGMSDWLAGKIVKSDRNRTDQLQSARIIKAQGTIGNLLTVPRISGDQYGASNAMVEILLARTKGSQFRDFFIAIKEGADPGEALKDNFGLSYQDLELMYMQMASRVK